MNTLQKSTAHTSTAAATVSEWLRNYLYYSTLIYVFSLLWMGASGIGITKIIEVNLLLMCLVVKVTRIPRWMLWFVLYF